MLVSVVCFIDYCKLSTVAHVTTIFLLVSSSNNAI